MSFLNDSRTRSSVAGAVGGSVGWLLSQSVGDSEAGFDTSQVMTIGAMVGLAIAGLLGSAEGLMLSSNRLALRGAIIGSLIGGIGGALGAGIGQFGFLATSNSDKIGDNSISHRSLFSPQMRERLEKAGAKVGDIEIGLEWKNKNDLDLHVVDPAGEQIYFQHRVSASRGELDVDRNVSFDTASVDPVEHVYWPRGGAPEGNYRIYVHFYRQHLSQPSSTDYHIEVVSSAGRRPFDGTVKAGDPPQFVCQFDQDNSPVMEEVTKTSVGLLGFVGLILGWTIFGGLVGISEGFRRKSVTAMRNASMGGTLGGALGGIAFVLLVAASNTYGRLLGFLVLGACIGLWMVLIDRVLSATLRVRNGKYEGREIMLDRAEMRIGRNEMFEVYLGGDPEIQLNHAVVRSDAGKHLIEAIDGKVSVNNQECASKLLSDGDLIEVGSTRLVYSCKGNIKPEQISQNTTSAPPRTIAPPPPRRGESVSAASSNTTRTSGKDVLPDRAGDGRSQFGPPPPRR